MGNAGSVDSQQTEFRAHSVPLKLPMPEPGELEERFAVVLVSAGPIVCGERVGPAGKGRRGPPAGLRGGAGGEPRSPRAWPGGGERGGRPGTGEKLGARRELPRRALPAAAAAPVPRRAGGTGGLGGAVPPAPHGPAGGGGTGLRRGWGRRVCRLRLFVSGAPKEPPSPEPRRFPHAGLCPSSGGPGEEPPAGSSPRRLAGAAGPGRRRAGGSGRAGAGASGRGEPRCGLASAWRLPGARAGEGTAPFGRPWGGGTPREPPVRPCPRPRHVCAVRPGRARGCRRVCPALASSSVFSPGWHGGLRV